MQGTEIEIELEEIIKISAQNVKAMKTRRLRSAEYIASMTTIAGSYSTPLTLPRLENEATRRGEKIGLRIFGLK